MLVIVDYSSINEQWLKEGQILQILSFLDSQRIWEESFEEEEITCSICTTRNYLGMGGGIVSTVKFKNSNKKSSAHSRKSVNET